MKLPTLRGVIDRRILANYRIDPEVLAQVLPPPFRPKLISGCGIGGICLIRLRGIRPRFFPSFLGFSSENAAHRFAVQWEDRGQVHEGVYVPRRDTSSRVNALVGGRVFPGVHHLASFDVRETEESFAVALNSVDDATHVRVEGCLESELPSSSIFSSLTEASDFFEAGSLGYSATARKGVFDGIELHVPVWVTEPLDVTRVESSYFEDRGRFPAGSTEFDCALLMRDIRHEWFAREELSAAANESSPSVPR